MEKFRETIESAIESSKFNDIEYNIWQERRVYFNRPDVSRKYQDVGYVDLNTLKVFPMNVAEKYFKARTTDEKAYVDFLKDVAEKLASHFQY